MFEKGGALSIEGLQNKDYIRSVAFVRKRNWRKGARQKKKGTVEEISIGSLYYQFGFFEALLPIPEENKFHFVERNALRFHISHFIDQIHYYGRRYECSVTISNHEIKKIC